MQPNTITLSVNVSGDGTTMVDQLFTRTEELVGRSTYRGPTNTLISRDNLQFYRTYPKRSGDFLGAAKVSAKTTLDVTVPSASGVDTKAPCIMEFSVSAPVGLQSADAVALRQRIIALLKREDIVGLLIAQLDI